MPANPQETEEAPAANMATRTRALAKSLGHGEPEGVVVAEHEAGSPAQQLTLFGTTDPQAIIARATRTADALAEVINKRKLYQVINDRKYVLVEGWTLLGSMMGVFPRTVWTHPIAALDGDGKSYEVGFEARVEAVTSAGLVVGAAEAQCTHDEKMWKNRDAYALRGMAQTRATSRALRQPLGFVLKLAGFEATGAEEMPK